MGENFTNYLIRDIMEGYAAILTFNVTKVTFANKPVTCSPRSLTAQGAQTSKYLERITIRTNA